MAPLIDLVNLVEGAEGEFDALVINQKSAPQSSPCFFLFEA